MPFTPNGTVKLLAGIPLDNSYTHTVRYADRSAQTTAFAAKAAHTYEHLTYIRETSRIRVPNCSDDIIECNYLMYQNLNYGRDKWFYAFITGVHYVNDNCSEIEFEIDVMQTWMYDYSFKPCFIERNHTPTDVVGENTIPESFSVNRYHVEDVVSTIDTMFKDWDVVMYATFDPSTYTYFGGDGANGIWSGLDQTIIGKVSITNTNGQISHTWSRRPTTILKDIVDNHATLVDGVVCLVMRPDHFYANPQDNVTVNKPTMFGGYTPKNKKLLTYPFTKLFVTDGNGGGRDYAFEEFSGNPTEAHFFITADNAPNESVSCIPTMYKGAIYDITEAVVMSGFPQCSWASDSFKQYIANNQSNLMLSTAMGAAQVAGGLLLAVGTEGVGAGVGLGMITSGATQIAGILGKTLQETKKPNQAHGSVTNSSFFTQGRKGFEFFTLRPVTEEYMIIDDYFSMFGYAINRVDVPNISSRPYWNYIKTQNALIIPDGINGLPTTDIRQIESIHNTGITYWKTLDNVGNYSLNNSPV